MSSSRDLMPEEADMKNAPNKTAASSRLRKSPHGSIYVPPPLRKRKTNSDVKKNVQAEAGSFQEVCKNVAIHVNPSVVVQPNRNKKCENSYLLFGLEDKSDRPKSREKEPERLPVKDHSPTVKKCDNSYLLFGEDGEPSQFADTVQDKLWKKQVPTRLEDPYSARNSELLSRMKPLDSIIVPYLPDELSCGVGSLSVGNKPPKISSLPIKDSRETKAGGKQPSQKKCDNSYFLFDDDDSDSKYGKTPYREKSLNQSVDRLHHPAAERLEHPTLLRMSLEDMEVSSDKPCKINTASRTCDPCVSSEDMQESANPKSIDVQSSTNISFEGSDNIEDYVIEIYDFPKSMRTQDLMTIFSVYVQDGFFIKWVDDTHALGVFSNPCLVSDVLKKSFDQVSVRCLQSATAASLEAASTVPVPSGSRPRTCPSLARRLVSGALGLRVSVSDEIRRAEKKMLQDAKEERRLAAKQREEAWEGTLRNNLAT